MLIRPAITSDIDAIVRVHIESWQAQFTPFLTPEQVRFKDLDVVNQRVLWQRRFSEEEGETRFTFVAEQDNTPVGYITGCLTPVKFDAELHQIYVLPAFHRKGFGQALVVQLARALDAKAVTSLFVWVMTINPAVVFYRDRLGGTYFDTRVIPDGDGILKEAGYRWSTMEDLLK